MDEADSAGNYGIAGSENVKIPAFIRMEEDELNNSRISTDIPEVDTAFPPDAHALFIEDRLLGVVYMANGEGPHKTVVLLHGFPGNEKNFDVAQALRRGGYNVLVFHYSGSWGSRGKYAFSRNYEDLKAVRKIMDNDVFAAEHRIDRNAVYLAGHSVGGFLTLMAARDGMDFCGFAALAPYDLGVQGRRIEAGDKQALAETTDLFEQGLPPLHGATVGSLLSDVAQNHREWDLLSEPSVFSERNMLLVVATNDMVATTDVHQIPVAETMELAGGKKKVVQLPCTHDFAEKRVALAQTLYDWLQS